MADQVYALPMIDLGKVTHISGKKYYITSWGSYED
jgi:hypothetical protein